MKYTISKYKNDYVVKKNNDPVSLVGVGLLTFKTKQEAQEYIKLVRVSSYYISQGIPE